MAETTIRALKVRLAEIPLERPATVGGVRILSTMILLVDLESSSGAAGRAYLHVFQPSRTRPFLDLFLSMSDWLAGHPATPETLERTLRARLEERLAKEPDLGAAVGLVDMACWDLRAIETDLPLARLHTPERIPVSAYLTSALGCADPDSTAEEAAQAAQRGFGGYKIQLGHGTLEEDVAAVRAARTALPAGMALMVDYVQSLSRGEAIRRGRRLDDEGLDWIEDPIPCDDLEGYAAVAQALTTPIQIGETFIGTDALAASITAKASDYVMIDLPRIRGVSGWLRAAGLAADASIPLSSHLYPEFAVHLLAAAPTRHWLEFSDMAAPVLLERPEIREGVAIVPSRPGAGIAWNEDALRRYAVAP